MITYTRKEVNPAMPIVKWTPFDAMVDEFFGDSFAPLMRAQGFSPALDIYETKDAVVIETPLAGVTPDQVKIEVEDNVLKISGTAEHKSEVDDAHYYRKEVRTGSFYRAVALPKAVSGDQASATFEKGMLMITIPKAEQAKPKTIAIKAA